MASTSRSRNENEYTLYEILTLLEDSGVPVRSDEEIQLNIQPPNNANDDVTDDDSGDEDVVTTNNLPRSQLLAPTELPQLIQDANKEENNIVGDPLEPAVKKMNRKTEKKIYDWSSQDLNADWTYTAHVIRILKVLGRPDRKRDLWGQRPLLVSNDNHQYTLRACPRVVIWGPLVYGMTVPKTQKVLAPPALNTVCIFHLFDQLCGLIVKSFWLQIPKPRVQSLTHLCSGSGTGKTQSCEYKI
uniref:Uncharacterized protein n=1 Tax=Timema tahoe TaxID=61484 RepID=A0A7R9IDA9_9NEOP|nr:unnamed protein product [Timema tahoe]